MQEYTIYDDIDEYDGIDAHLASRKTNECDGRHSSEQLREL